MHSELLLLPLLSVGLNLPDYFACCQTYSTHRKSSSCSVVVHLSSGSLLRPSSSSFTLLGILTLFTSASCSCSCATPDVGNLLSICCDCKECHLGLSLLQSVSPLFVPLNLVPFKVARSQLTHCCCRSTSPRLNYCGSTSCSSTSIYAATSRAGSCSMYCWNWAGVITGARPAGFLYFFFTAAFLRAACSSVFDVTGLGALAMQKLQKFCF